MKTTDQLHIAEELQTVLILDANIKDQLVQFSIIDEKLYAEVIENQHRIIQEVKNLVSAYGPQTKL
jgi:hypothetical protein